MPVFAKIRLLHFKQLQSGKELKIIGVHVNASTSPRVCLCVCVRARAAVDSLCHYIAMSQSGGEKEVIVGLLSYRDGAMWEEERAEWSGDEREGEKEKNSNETRRRWRAEAL